MSPLDVAKKFILSMPRHSVVAGSDAAVFHVCRHQVQNLLLPAALTAAAVAVAAVVNHRLAKKAERENPPSGRTIEVNRVRLHDLERSTLLYPMIGEHIHGPTGQNRRSRNAQPVEITDGEPPILPRP